MAALHAAYDGRVAPSTTTASRSRRRRTPSSWPGWCPTGPALEVDLVTHSRGGLVGREIASAGDLTVTGLVMVASPNAGTVLADREHLSDLLDRITDLAQFVPDNGVTDTLGLVLAVLKQLAVGAVGGLDGIMAMNPSEDYLEELNGRPAPDAVLRAIAADYEPPRGAPLARVARDGATDLVFKSADNDLVVPTAGCWDVDGRGRVPDRRAAGPRRVRRRSTTTRSSGSRRSPSQLLEWLPTRDARARSWGRTWRTCTRSSTPALRAWAIEGSGSHGAGLTRHLTRSSRSWSSSWIVPNAPSRRHGAKSDPLDAVRAAREALGRGPGWAPRSVCRVLGRRWRCCMAIRRSAVQASTDRPSAALLVLLISAPEPSVSRFRGQTIARHALALLPGCGSTYRCYIETVHLPSLCLRDLGPPRSRS